MDLNGKVAIVTGGSSGIGAAIVSLSSLSVITNALPCGHMVRWGKMRLKFVGGPCEWLGGCSAARLF